MFMRGLGQPGDSTLLTWEFHTTVCTTLRYTQATLALKLAFIQYAT